jgi:hypothetical protein
MDGGVNAVETPNGMACVSGMTTSDPLCTEQFKNFNFTMLKVTTDPGYMFTGWIVNGTPAKQAAGPLFLTTRPGLASRSDLLPPGTTEVNVESECQGASITGKFRIPGHGNQAEYEMMMSEVTENQTTFLRTLGGIRLHLEAILPDAANVTTYTWSTDVGTFFGSYALTASPLTGSTVSGVTLNSIYWQSPPQTDVNATITLMMTLSGSTNTTMISKMIRSRTLQEGVGGDDVKMLQTILRSIGVSEPVSSGLCSGTTTYGYCGTPITLQEPFTPNLKTAVVRFQQRDELQSTDGIVGVNTLARLLLHWTDYLSAFEMYIQSSIINSSHPDFNSWLAGGSETLDDTLQDVFASDMAPTSPPTETRQRILHAWAQHESEGRHWGYQLPYRVHLGGYDNRGSIGFSQIQNRYKYGVNSGDNVFDGTNLSHPGDNIKGFGLWSGEFGARSFYHAFVSNEYNGTPTEITYPKLQSIYFTNGAYNVRATDRLGKGLAGFKQGTYVENDNGVRVLFHEIWPEMLRKYPNDTLNSDSDVKTAIRYALEVQSTTLSGQQTPITGFDLNTRAWNWVKLVGNQESVCCTYSEYNWLTGISWEEKCQVPCQ